MSHSSERRAQVEPLAAIVAVFAVGAGLTIYAGVLDDELPGQDRQHVAGPTADRLTAAIQHGGVVEPGRLSRRSTAAPDGYTLNATVSTATSRWHAGPTPPARAQTAREQVSVRVAPGRVRPGRLTVRVWR
ncbi:hypothetical protein ACFR9U_08100 [Halorientalis brevis]|uniref:Archaeal Type IV pilin N-terminal domain-containing protein n=1 Tax=Halorientalis brevis TaxID=1126241 RepID=A0ABD6CAH6_9EURY|nr:hypothetical protein [Halorientalis brevis]